MTLQGTGQANLKGGTMMPISWFIVVENIDKWQEIQNNITKKFGDKKANA